MEHYRKEEASFPVVEASQQGRVQAKVGAILLEARNKEGPRMNRTARIAILVISVAVFCYAGLGHVLGQTHEERAYKSLTVYGEVLQKIQQDYVDDPNMHLVTAGALHGLLESLVRNRANLHPGDNVDNKQKGP